MRRRPIFSSFVINALCGTLFGWSLFLQPLEQLLQVSRGTLSLVPAVAIVGFTAGMLVHDRLIRRFGLGRTGAAALCVGGLGHLLFWCSPSFPSLFVGYGAAFGLANGIGYGVAVAMARTASVSGGSELIGLPIAAYAVTGILMSGAVYAFGEPADLPLTLGLIGLVLIVAGLSIGFRAMDTRSTHDATPVEPPPAALSGERRDFALIVGAFFGLCFVGLTFVGHSTAILVDRGLPAGPSTWAPLLLNSGYIVGALLGGGAGRWMAPRVAASLALVLAALGASGVLLMPGQGAVLAALVLVGAAFGSSAAVFFLVLSARFGAARSGRLFGRLMLGYGLAGLLAPAVAGYLKDLTQGYAGAVFLAVSVALLGLLALSLSHPRGALVAAN